MSLISGLNSSTPINNYGANASKTSTTNNTDSSSIFTQSSALSSSSKSDAISGKSSSVFDTYTLDEISSKKQEKNQLENDIRNLDIQIEGANGIQSYNTTGNGLERSEVEANSKQFSTQAQNLQSQRDNKQARLDKVNEEIHKMEQQNYAAEKTTGKNEKAIKSASTLNWNPKSTT